MAGKVYKTAQGTQLNIDHLRLLNEGVVAVGNMHVNARGDQVNADGSVKQTRTDIMRKNYRLNANLVKTQNGATMAPSIQTPKASRVTRDYERPSRSANTPSSETLTTVNTTPRSPEPKVNDAVSSDSLRGSLANLIVNAPYRPGEEIVEEESETIEGSQTQEVSDLFSTSEPTQRTITRI